MKKKEGRYIISVTEKKTRIKPNNTTKNITKKTRESTHKCPMCGRFKITHGGDIIWRD